MNYIYDMWVSVVWIILESTIKVSNRSSWRELTETALPLPKSPLHKEFPNLFFKNWSTVDLLFEAYSTMIQYFIHSTWYLLVPYLMPSTIFLPIDTCYFSIFVSVYLFCYIKLPVLFFQISHVNDDIHYVPFSVWHISLSIILSRSVHMVGNGGISFFSWLSIITLCVLSIHLLMGIQVASTYWL